MFLISKSFWEVRPTKNMGRGIFAKKEIKKGAVIGDYLGKMIKNIEFTKDLEKEGLYLMYFNDDASIFPNLKSTDIHLMNNSCNPNCGFYFYKWHTLFFALKNIKPNEQLTISYMLGPKEECINCTHNCLCGEQNCTKTMHTKKAKYNKWRKYQDTLQKNTKVTKFTFGKNLPKLKKYPKIIKNAYT